MMKLKHCHGSEASWASTLPRLRKVSVHGPKTMLLIACHGPRVAQRARYWNVGGSFALRRGHTSIGSFAIRSSAPADRQ